jgi:hypothetical protein
MKLVALAWPDAPESDNRPSVVMKNKVISVRQLKERWS